MAFIFQRFFFLSVFLVLFLTHPFRHKPRPLQTLCGAIPERAPSHREPQFPRKLAGILIDDVLCSPTSSPPRMLLPIKFRGVISLMAFTSLHTLKTTNPLNDHCPPPHLHRPFQRPIPYNLPTSQKYVILAVQTPTDKNAKLREKKEKKK